MAFNRFVISATVIIWLMVVTFGQSFVGRYAHSYRRSLHVGGAELPIVTTEFGLPVLGQGDFSGRPEQWQWYAVRLCILAPAVAMLFVTWCVRRERTLMLLYVLGLPLYLAGIALLTVFVVGSLWLPFQVGSCAPLRSPASAGSA